jgi:Ca-activated chloride channel family protein
VSFSSSSSPSSHVSPETLALRETHLSVSARGGLARLVLEQRFENPHDEPLHVTYVLPLPHEAAVSGFTFELGERTVRGEIDTRHKARERFEEAVASGHTAALLEEERSTVFTQEIGNVPPRTAVVARIEIDMRLVWFGATSASRGSQGQWELRFPLALAPRYLGGAGRVPDASRIAVALVDELPVRAGLSLRIGDRLPEGRSPESPSHALQCVKASQGEGFEVGFGGDGRVPLDRDVVVRWDAATMEPAATTSVYAEPNDPDAHVLLTVVPPSPLAATRALARDLTVLLDTSGSMGGEPLAQAKRFASALVASLSSEDTLHLLEFSNDTRAFRPSAVAATDATKREALAWIRALRASGGTEMRTGILRALADVKPGRQAQVVLVTDGLIGFETEIVSAILRDNAQGARVHTVGVGSSVNRSLLAPAARAGRGLEVVCGLGEDVEPLVERLLARTTAPLVTELAIVGEGLVDRALSKLPDLFAGAPALVPLKVSRSGASLTLTGKTAEGTFSRVLVIPPVGSAGAETSLATVRTLYGREAVEDLEMRLAAGESKREIDRAVEALGLTYRIVTRHTSFVAVDETRTVDPTRATRRVDVPQAVPFGTSAESFGVRSSQVMPVTTRGPLGIREEGFAPQGRAVMPPLGAALPPPPPAPAPASPAARSVPMRPAMAPAPKVAAPSASSSGGGGEGEKRKKESARSSEISAPVFREESPSEQDDRASSAEKPSLFRRAIEAVFGRDDDRAEGDDEVPADEMLDDEMRDEGMLDDDASELALPPAFHAQPTLSVPARTLTARLRAWDGTVLTLEITVEDELDLSIVTVVAVFSDGTRLEVAVDRTKTTADGRYGRGTVVRLHGRVPGASAKGEPELVEITGNGAPLHVRVVRA